MNTDSLLVEELAALIRPFINPQPAEAIPISHSRIGLACSFFTDVAGVLKKPPHDQRWTAIDVHGVPFGEDAPFINVNPIGLLEVGFRPLIIGEVIKEGDEYLDENGKWDRFQYLPMILHPGNTATRWFTRTRRAVPFEFLPAPAPDPDAIPF
jgi:hypothetical protein